MKKILILIILPYFIAGSAYASTGTISATNAPFLPVAGGGAEGTTTISWNAIGASSPVVKVSVNGATESIFCNGVAQGSQTATWIVTSNHYVFTLYDGTSPLASTSINGVRGIISASVSNFVVPAGTTSTTTITWNSAGATNPNVKVSMNGATETSFSNMVPQGSQTATWIASRCTYLFTLYDGTAPLASTYVTSAPGVISASPTRFALPSGAVGTSTITWNSAGAVSPNVKVSVNGGTESVFRNGVAQGSQNAAWIVPGNRYVFTLYDGTTSLNRVNVTAAPVFRSTYYHCLQGSIWAELADDTGVSPTPRAEAIASIQNNFQAMKQLGFDTVTITLPDSDTWRSQHGGGFSYDPANSSAARPQFAVAQEIMLRLADANQLKVNFTVSFSDYRRSTDGRSAWSGLADQYDSTSSIPGAYDYIHALIDPTAFYGTSLVTTKLETVGLTNGPVISHVGDTRVTGWLLAPEWNPYMINTASGLSTHGYVFKKYWNYFYNLVHTGGVNTAFAGTYVLSAPSSEVTSVASVKAFKQWFAPGTGIEQPDLVGIEFYGYNPYDLTGTYNDLTSIVTAVEQADTVHYPGDFAIPSGQIFLGEGSTDETATPAINRFFEDVMQVVADTGLAGIQFWVSDMTEDVQGPPISISPVSSTPIFDLFNTTFVSAGSRTYAALPPGISWHNDPSPSGSGVNADPTNYVATTDLRAAAYGTLTYGSLTSKGAWVEEVLANHAGAMNLRFYATVNPMQGSSGIGVTGFYWDVSRMPGVTSVEVHSGSISGPLVGAGGATGTTSQISTTDGALFYLVNVTGGAHTSLSRVTVDVQ